MVDRCRAQSGSAVGDAGHGGTFHTKFVCGRNFAGCGHAHRVGAAHPQVANLSRRVVAWPGDRGIDPVWPATDVAAKPGTRAKGSRKLARQHSTTPLMPEPSTMATSGGRACARSTKPAKESPSLMHHPATAIVHRCARALPTWRG